jgi:haloalkane dehalogenase
MLQILRTPDGVPFLRTDEAAFEGLPDYPFAPRYIEVEGLRLHYVDEGPRDGPTVLLMHGMPTWSFLNRHIIRDLVAAGYRCIAADHIGFGRSDKVIDDSWYSITRHVEAHRVLVESLDLREATLFCQDWGGPIGLAQAARSPERFSRLVIMNTWLHHEAYAYTDALRRWNAGWKHGPATSSTERSDHAQVADGWRAGTRHPRPALVGLAVKRRKCLNSRRDAVTLV